jgi:hypothetical protein
MLAERGTRTDHVGARKKEVGSSWAVCVSPGKRLAAVDKAWDRAFRDLQDFHVTL